MKVIGIEHIGIAVRRLADSSPFWKSVLNLESTGRETVEEQGVRTENFAAGTGKIELLEATDEASPVARYLKTHPPGVHHICLEVEDIQEAIRECREQGVELIKDRPIVGVEGFLTVFIHPRSSGGVLVELSQKPR